jgi:hypothetical protein
VDVDIHSFFQVRRKLLLNKLLGGGRGASRSLEGGALSGNSSYISYIWIMNIFIILRGRGGPSRFLEGGALNGNSSYISYIWILNILKSLGGGGAPAAFWRVAHLMEIQVTSKKCRKCKLNFH